MTNPEPARTPAEIPTRPAIPPADWPTFHLTHPGPGTAWPADPNAAFFWNGRYHLHYLYDRSAEAGPGLPRRVLTDSDDLAFAHVSSTDLVHWRWHPTTLTRDTLGHRPYSGTGFITREGRPAIIYPGGGSGANHVVLAEDDDLEQWSAPIEARVRLREGQDGEAIVHSDPDAWLDGDTYCAIFGGNPVTRARATAFRSTDLANWEYLGPFLETDLPDAADDADISCPNFFPIGNKHMLLCISHNKGCRYYLGEWRDERFTPDFHGRMNWNAQDVFAPESVLTPDGRRVMWAWAAVGVPWTDPGYRDFPIQVPLPAGPLSGIQTLPRELELPEDGVLRIRPLRELEILRTDERRMTGIEVAAGESRTLEGISGDALELEVRIRPGSAERFGVRVHRAEEGDTGLGITIDPSRGTMSMGDVEAPFDLGDDRELRLRVFVDKHIVEAFANDRQAMLVAHEVDPAHTGVALFGEGGAIVADVAAWRMTSIYEAPAAG